MLDQRLLSPALSRPTSFDHFDLQMVPFGNFPCMYSIALYAFVIVRLDRRDLVWINVTANPTAEWVARQITEAFPWDEAPHCLIRDRDRIYGSVVTRRLRAMGIRDRPTAPASPWQNGFAERLIGSIRRECADHIIVLGEMHLRRVLKSYADYYNCVRTHRSLNKDASVSRPVQRTGVISSHAILTTTPESKTARQARLLAGSQAARCFFDSPRNSPHDKALLPRVVVFSPDWTPACTASSHASLNRWRGRASERPARSAVFYSGAASTQARLEAARAAAGPPSHWLLRRPLLFPRKHHALRVHRLIHAMPSPTSSRNMLPWRALPHRDDGLLEPRAAGPGGRRPKPSLGPHPAAVAMFLPSQ
jgi:hypothetical protein